MRLRTPALLFLLLVMAHTWPLSSSPAHLSLNHNADAELCAWTLSWIAHILPTNPAHLFDGNIFAPEPHTLTYTDPMLAPAVVAAPVRWLGGSPVLAFNLAMMVGLWLTAMATWWGARRWSGSDRAALVAGALAAFNAHLLTRLPHIVAAWVWTVPASIALVDRLLDRPRPRDAALLTLVVAATAVTSPYWLAQVAVVIAIAAVMALVLRGWRSAILLAASSVTGVLIALPVLWPYVRFAQTGVSRPIESVAQFSATLSGYLSSVARVHAGWSRPFYRDDVNVWFAGVTALVLAALGAWALWRTGRTGRRRLALLGLVAVTGVLLSLGPATAIYRGLYNLLMPLRGLRAVARFGYLYLTAIAFAAAIGVAAVERQARTTAQRLAVVAGALGLVTIEAWTGPVKTEAFSGIPAIYRYVADAPDPVRLVELPFYVPEGIFLNGEYVLNATAHWKPLMNGYSGYIPDGYRAWADRLWYFPEERAMRAIADARATHVMVHAEKFTPSENVAIEQALRQSSLLELVATDSRGHRLYRVRRPEP